jgi:large subunit ribosomal protein L4
MSVKHYSATGAKQTGAIKLPEATLSETGLSRVVRIQIANGKRQRAQAKTRGMVRGGGAKPWKQKGTGRARAGTNNSPLWRSGGIIFGPTGLPRAKKGLPRGMAGAGIATALAALDKDERLSVISGKLNVPKSKDAANLLAKIVPEGTALFVVAQDELPNALGVRNIEGVELTTADDTNVADLLRYSQTVLTAAALDGLTKKDASKRSKKPLAASPKVVESKS